MKKIKSFLFKYLPIIFGCHTRNDRSFFIKNKKFPICARCTGELIGILLSIFIYAFFKTSIFINLLLMLPLILDGFIQLFTKYESNNFKRLITGILFGFALTNIFITSVISTYNLGQHIGNIL